MQRKFSLYKLTPSQSLLLGFILIILVGAFLLTLPIASSKGISQCFIDALFTATSAVTTTGLVVVDTGSFYSLFGQIVILILFQIGGLGYMIFIVLIVLGLGGRLSFGSRLLLRESLKRPTSVDMIKFVKMIVIFAAFFEIVGASLLSFYWMQYFPVSQAIYTGVFHSVSGFCTAGFGLFSDSLSSYQGSIFLNLVIVVICMAGGIGFFVLYDIYGFCGKLFTSQKHHPISVHTKLALIPSITIMAIGTGVIFLAEKGLQLLPLGKGLVSSAFQSISASTTTGFNTINIGALSSTSLFTIIVLMFIGASPGGTGGGIKTTTFGTMLIFLFSLLTGREDVNIFKKRIPIKTINEAFAIGLISILWVILSTAILTSIENTTFLNILFETVSAFGTVGLSTGITSNLSIIGKVVLSITMLIGRMGSLVIGFSLIGRPRPVSFRYAEAEILIG